MSEQCLVIGHKGTLPGNTRESLQRAIDLGVDMIELDIRVSKDGVPLIWHDKDIKNFLIKDTSVRQLKTVAPDTITLSEALAICGNMPILLDVKPHVDCKPIFTILKSLPEEQLANYKVTSFSPRILRKFLKEMPEIPRFVLERWSGIKAGYHARRAKTTNVIMRKSALWSLYIRAVTKRGYTVYTYTLNNPKTANRWIRAGLSGVITDYPERFVKQPDNA